MEFFMDSPGYEFDRALSNGPAPTDKYQLEHSASGRPLGSTQKRTSINMGSLNKSTEEIYIFPAIEGKRPSPAVSDEFLLYTPVRLTEPLGIPTKQSSQLILNTPKDQPRTKFETIQEFCIEKQTTPLLNMIQRLDSKGGITDLATGGIKGDHLYIPSPALLLSEDSNFISEITQGDSNSNTGLSTPGKKFFFLQNRNQTPCLLVLIESGTHHPKRISPLKILKVARTTLKKFLP